MIDITVGMAMYTESGFDQRLSAALDTHVDHRTPARLVDAINYAVFPGGHRIRPKISLAVAEACGCKHDEIAFAAAAAIELMHCASLVHDDMPCFDNAALRRGKPSVHAAFGEQLALLTGDALIVLAYQVLAAGSVAKPSVFLTLSQIVGANVGLPRGIVAGQAWECESSIDLETYHRAKTGALFAASTLTGAAASGASHEEWAPMGKYLGEAYQVADDLLDCNGDAQVIGKPIGQDKELGRPNYVIEKGSSAASVKLRELVRLAEQSVPDCPGRDELQAKIRSESQSFVNPALGARQAA